jgi:hypothetical protein
MYLPWSRYLVLVFMCAVLCVVSIAIAYANFGKDAAAWAMTVSDSVSAAYLVVGMVVWGLQRRSGRYGIVAACSLVLAAASMTLAASLPIFYVLPIQSAGGAALLLVVVVGLFRQGVLSRRHFMTQWALCGQQSWQRAASGSHIDLSRFADELRLKDAPFYLKTRSGLANVSLGAVLLGALIMGLNLRKVDATLALVLWAVPGLLLAAWMAHPVVMAASQWQVLCRKEQEHGRRYLAAGTFW